MTKRIEPTKRQKLQFAKGFWWGRREHNFERYTTYFLVIGFLFLVAGLLGRRIWQLVSIPMLVLALLFKMLAGFAHRMEKHYNDKLRYGRWKKRIK